MSLFPTISSGFSKRRYEALPHEVDKTLNICLICTVFFTTVILFLLLAVSFDTYLHSEKNAALRGSLYWSPILDDVELPQRIATMNSTLLPPPDPSIARQEPGPENDAEWYKYNDTPLFWLTREEIEKLGQNPGTAARWDREYWGHEEDLFVGKLDISHQIHCLDSLRKKAYADYPGYHPEHHHSKRKGSSNNMDWIHLGHCLDMLCRQEAPWPDFHLKRQCGNIDPMLEWAKGREVGDWHIAPRPKDAYLWPNPFVGEPDFEIGYPLGHHHQGEGNPRPNPSSNS
ncbi:hypothetical protein BO85DRAFT_465095 [Aspergillus piperis CBS 112811]|uniref:Uncharacterized protein n=1 Tax=Aspergillus piperis CBS 112811 TaxID=1448313 RepID=A0A8G1REX4_9EURO|nr:hypothetical protein BO85DRAFT_465095 [Aspergillus piperis CBS 112811]RAH63165.1 hypothetical protein BO85DRAFT_465095 [Aspergillus piperis CBS 112811]